MGYIPRTGTGTKSTTVAVKTVHLANCKWKAIKAELDISLTLNHPNILPIIEYYTSPVDNPCWVMPRALGGSLCDQLEKRGRLTESEARVIFSQILDGVIYLHSRNILHRDLKGDNILLMDERSPPHVKIIDFGLSRLLAEGETAQTYCGTPNYTAPEVFRVAQRPRGDADGYSFPSDMWSVGVLLHTMLTACFLLDDCYTEAYHQEAALTHVCCEIRRPGFPKWRGLSQQAQDLMAKLLTNNPSQRLTAQQTRQHPWLLQR